MASEKDVPVISLSNAKGAKESWSKPTVVILLWIIAEWIFITNSLQLSSRIRKSVLQLFGAKIGKRVILRPRLRVKYPWNLEIGDDCWIGEGVWIHNQDKVKIENDVCLSQESFITTGSHSFRTDMSLVTKPVFIEAGVWVCSRSIVTMGSHLGRSCLIPAGSVVSGYVEPGVVFGRIGRDRF